MYAQRYSILFDPWAVACQALLGENSMNMEARILEWVAISSSRGSSQSNLSCIGRQILYHRVTWEALHIQYLTPKCKMFILH